MDLIDYAKQAIKTDGKNYDFEYYFLKLGSEAGEVQQEEANYIKGKITFNELQHNVQDELGDMMWYWIMIHAKLGLDPTQTLRNNIQKLKDRYNKF